MLPEIDKLLPEKVDTGLAIFFARPLGGVELEVVISSIELLWALVLLSLPYALTSSQTFVIFWGVLPATLVALPWLVAGSSNLIGIRLMVIGNTICAPLRFSGS